MSNIFSKEELSKIFSQNISSDVFGICINSKEIQNGDLFVALKGEKTDGHKFVKNAIDQGAALALVEEKIDLISEDKLIFVPSTYEALLKLAKYNLSQAKNTKYIAVTGSVGKTTTKNMIFHILNEVIKDNKIYVSKKNYNSQIGLPICAAIMPRDTKIAVFEMAMSSTGDIKKLLEIVNPTVSIITTIGENHLEFFESPFDIAKAKSEIFEKGSEIAIIPNDSPYAEYLKDKAKKCGVKTIISFGEEKKADVRILSCKFDNDFLIIKTDFFGTVIEYKLNCSNISFAQNSAAAISGAHFISGIDLKILANAISSFPTTSKRNEVIHIKDKNITIIDDSYNAAPTSMRAALRSLGLRKSEGRKIAVMGDMLELGRNAVHLHENLSATIDKYGIDLVFACGELSKRLFNNLQEQKRGDWKENSHELAESVIKEIKNGDSVLVKGSHSMNMDYIVDVLKNNFA